MKKKYLRWHDPEVLHTLINMQLNKYNLTVDNVKKQEIIDGVNWYDYYTLTKDEYNLWKEKAIYFLRNMVRPKYSMKLINKELMFFDLMYSLKVI